MPHPLHVDERYPSGDRARALTDEPVRYSQVWEDHDVLRRALAIAHGADVLSICGAGCNVLSLLLEEPRSVVAVDVNPAQTALLELKLVALRRLSHGEFAAFLGARIAVDREATYERLRADLGRDARAYWDEHPVEIHDGVLCSGSLDRHVRAFAEECVATQVDPAAVVAFLELSSPELQRAAFTRDLAVLERPARTWFGRARLLAEWARHGAQFRRAGSVDVGEVFWHRFVEVATTVPASSNFYLEWLLTGRYRSLAAGPPLLRPNNFARLRELADRVRIVRGELSEVLASQPRQAFDAANLSDVLEHLSEDEADATITALASRMRPGGRVAWWTLFGAGSGVGADRLRPVPGLGDELFFDDRVPFAGGLEVREALPAPALSLL